VDVFVSVRFGLVALHEAENARWMSGDTIRGTLRQYERPVWQPLINLVGEELAGWFMWMHEIELADETPVHAYKHVDTRRYLHLTEDGRAFAYKPKWHYAEIALLEAVRDAFAGRVTLPT
jgi:hypothetical protein